MKKALCMILAAAMLLLCGCTSGEPAAEAGYGPLVPKPLMPNAVTENPYMAKSENSVHNDTYSSDVTNAVLPLGIDSSVRLSLETTNPQAPSAAFYDEDGNAVTPFNGGVAIVDMDGDTITRKGMFVPAIHDTAPYRVQISYAFVDSRDNVVLPTSHGHVIVVQTKDEVGNIYPLFRKILDVDIAGAIRAELGDSVDTRLLSIVYDYEGNLWFVTGGFRIHPDHNPAGVLGYIDGEYMQRTMDGEHLSPDGYVHLYQLEQGESAENGISAGEQGAVILTNRACYLLNARDGVEVVWCTPYGSNGTNDAQPGSDFTGGGLAYGGGSTPTLTRELVLFTDNLDPVNLLALSAETGEVVASIPVLDGLDESIPVSVENSILVYSDGGERTSVLVCNWFGAGNAGLADPNADSSVQSYAALYDANWMAKGNAYIAPGMERVDVVKTPGGYMAEKVWFRDDIRDTAMVKLSTATGYYYGYWQNLDTGMWCYEVLDYATGETVYREDVSVHPGYNNLAVGMIPDVKGNALYCPTGNMEMACWQDNFVFLPHSPAKTISPNAMGRRYLTDGQFGALGGSGSAASYLMSARVDNLGGGYDLAFRITGLTGKAEDYTLYYMDSQGTLQTYPGQWSLEAGDVAVLHVTAEDGGVMDLNPAEKTTELSVILGK